MKEIYPIIMSDQFVRLAIVDDYSSFIWTVRYYETGDFQLILDVSDRNLSLIRRGFYVLRDDDENVGIIEDITITRNEDGHDQLIVKGRFLASILGRRIIAAQTTLNGKLSDCIEQLIDENIINPTDQTRQIANFSIESHEIATEIEAQYTGENLLDVISKLCETYGVGFKVTLNSNDEFVFELYEGIDRTYDQNVNDWVVFSDTYDNLVSSNYQANYEKVINAVLVAGEGEDPDRVTVWVDDNAVGLNRFENYQDKKNIKSNSGEISPADYEELLKEAGREKITPFNSAFTGQVYFQESQYKTVVNVGDICVIENKDWNIYINSRLVEVIESVDETGNYTILPSFAK